MKKLKSVRHKLLAGFGLVIMLIVAIGVYNYFSVRNVNIQTSEVVDRQVPFLVSNSRISYDIANRLAVSRAYLLYEGDQEYRSRFDKYSEESNKYEDEIRKRSTNHKFLNAVDEVAAWDRLVREKVFDTYDRAGRDAAMKNLMNQVEPEARELMTLFDDASHDREKGISESGNAVLKSGKANIAMFLIIATVAVIASVLIALMTARMIARPLHEVMDWMQSLAKGDLSRERLIPGSEDEVGQLVISANEVNDQMRDIMQEIGTVSERVTSQSEELTQSANEVKAGSAQIAVTMEDLAGGSEVQANKAVDLSSVMGELLKKVRNASESGREVNAASDAVLQLAAEGGEMMAASTEQMDKIETIVQEAVEKMKELDIHSSEISQLVGVIKDISDQTNLLALNASIEAARAGEHGKGFAVVASEVGKLAEQVGASVTNITHIVQTIQNDSGQVSASLQDGYEEVEEGLVRIKKTEQTFDEIRSSLSKMADRIDMISASLSEATKDSETAGHSIEEMASISEEAAAGVEETSATSQQAASSMEEITSSSIELAEMAEQLNGLVNRFKL